MFRFKFRNKALKLKIEENCLAHVKQQYVASVSYIKEGVTKNVNLNYIIDKRHLEELYTLYSLGQMYLNSKRTSIKILRIHVIPLKINIWLEVEVSQHQTGFQIGYSFWQSLISMFKN